MAVSPVPPTTVLGMGQTPKPRKKKPRRTVMPQMPQVSAQQIAMMQGGGNH